MYMYMHILTVSGPGAEALQLLGQLLRSQRLRRAGLVDRKIYRHM